MSIKVRLADGHGSNKESKINGEGELNVVIHPHPPKDESSITLPFRQFFTDNGTSTGSNNMAIDGSSTSVEFYISASQDYDIYIKTISAVIGDGGSPNLNSYGSLSALTNGLEWAYFSQEEGRYILADGLKTNLQFIRAAYTTGDIGTGTDAYLADVSGGVSEKSYLPVMDLSQTYGLPWGLRLRKGTTDKLIFCVRDNLSQLTTHDIIGYGIRF
jgi:hypothetical protein